MEKQSVESFYNNHGWDVVEGNTNDALINENLKPVAKDYVSKVRRRIRENLGSGDALLDVGCGPIQYPEYLEYSMNFQIRVCVDLSEKALQLAAQKIGSHGIFINGDYLDIATPGSAPFSGATMINVLYHVDKSKQELLVRKILRDLKSGARLVVVYSNPNTISARLTRFLVSVKRVVKGSRISRSDGRSTNPIYFYRFPLNFWERFDDIAKVDTKAWRTFSPALEKLLFRRYLGGNLLLRLIFRLENFKLWTRFAEYTLVVMEKK
jgi:ubiquinone/menaquinone biosynthesis C-methylase UbiE